MGLKSLSAIIIISLTLQSCANKKEDKDLKATVDAIASNSFAQRLQADARQTTIKIQNADGSLTEYKGNKSFDPFLIKSFLVGPASTNEKIKLAIKDFDDQKYFDLVEGIDDINDLQDAIEDQLGDFVELKSKEHMMREIMAHEYKALQPQVKVKRTYEFVCKDSPLNKTDKQIAFMTCLRNYMRGSLLSTYFEVINKSKVGEIADDTVFNEKLLEAFNVEKRGKEYYLMAIRDKILLDYEKRILNILYSINKREDEILKKQLNGYTGDLMKLADIFLSAVEKIEVKKGVPLLIGAPTKLAHVTRYILSQLTEKGQIKGVYDKFNHLGHSLLHSIPVSYFISKAYNGKEEAEIVSSVDFNYHLRTLGNFSRLGESIQKVVRIYKLEGKSKEVLDESLGKFAPTYEHPTVRVSIIDSGFTFTNYPELLYFNKNVPMLDLSDNDNNVFAFDTRKRRVSHGAMVGGAFLSVLAHHDRSILDTRSLDLGLTKVFPNYEIGSLYRLDNLGNTKFLTSIVNELNGKVDIASMSLGIYAKKELPKNDFLWLIAAGNFSLYNYDETIHGKSSCLNGTPNLDNTNILCVGALRKGVIEDSIADYSNAGDIPEVFTFESFNDVCKSGTSCATPGLAAGATMIKRRYPNLTSSQLKQVILKGAVFKKVEVRGHRGIRKSVENKELNLLDDKGTFKRAEYLKVKVFDPTNNDHMQRAYKEAQKILNKQDLEEYQGE